jgi:predicted acetyltransferase
VFASDGCVATLRSLDLEVTAPGGMPVPTEGITNVSVMPAQRRQGLLRQMMRRALDAAVARDRCLAALVASEYLIYGRFGFGPATTNAGYDIDVRRAGSVRLPRPGQQRVEECPIDDILTDGPELHVAEQWRDGDPDYALTVDDLIAVDPAAGAAIWRHLLDIEWVNRVAAPHVAPDDPLPLLLDNPRAYVTRPGAGADHLWLRILDVPGALQARCYNAPGSTVIEVTDQMRYAAGRYAIETRANGSSHVTRVDDPPDLTLDVAELARVYLGDQSFHRLAAAGLLTAHRDDAVARADWQFQTPQRPWCPDGF